ncbi:MAG: leucine-rich repeat protein [Prevotella sp.]|nr:leucine-rich repeat protein [Prevotella sp.]
MKNNKIEVMLTFFMLCLLSVNFISCQKENSNENNGEENNIIQILKSNKWITHNSSYGEGSGDHAWVDEESVILYFISDDTGIEYCINRDYDTDLGNSTSKYYFLFNYRVSGNMVVVTDENSNTYSYYYRDGFLVSEKSGTIYEPSQMTSTDYTFANSLGPKTGSCGSSLKYSYDERKKEIKISGSGRMYDYSSTNQPWHDYYIDKVIVQEGCTYIGTHAFHKISLISEIELPNSLIEIGDYAFCDAMISDFMVPTGLTKIGAYAFSDCEYLKNVNFYGCNSLEQISEYAFAFCPLKLGSFSVPKNIKKLGSFAFFSSSISSLSLNDKLEEIGNNVFGKLNTSKIDIPNSVKSIGTMAFIGTFSEIRIGTGLKTIGQIPFATSNSGKMYVNLGKPLSIQSGSSPYVILNTSGSNGEDGAKSWTLYVPKGSKSAYQNSVGWKSFKSIIEDSSLSNGNGNSDDNQGESGNNDNQGGSGNNDNQGGSDNPTIKVITGNATNITNNSAMVSGNISGVSLPITATLFYDTSSNLSSSSSTITRVRTNSVGNFTINLTDLKANTTYYYQAACLHDGQYYTGVVKSFNTKESSINTINGHEYVDLGLPSGTKWATCNLGASKPEKYGDYYAWGEIETKENFNVDNYEYFQGKTYVDIGSDISGTKYDVARTKWGGTWRMPTLEDAKEMIDNCTSEWTTFNGVYGCKFTSKSNGNSIFLPAAGRGLWNIAYTNVRGYYWTSTHDSKTIGLAYYIGFRSSGVDSPIIPNQRIWGKSVRPVANK